MQQKRVDIYLVLTDSVWLEFCGNFNWCKADFETSSIKFSINVAKSLHLFETSCFIASFGFGSSYNILPVHVSFIYLFLKYKLW